MTDSIEMNNRLQSPLTGKSVEELLLFVADDDRGFKSEATDRLLSMGLTAIYPVLEKGVRDNDNADFRNGAMDMLVAFGRESVAPLVKLLKDQDEEVRNFACVMLGDIGSREAVHPLIKALSDKDVNVSQSAAEALGKIGDRSALFPLMELLKGDFWVQYSAINAIGAMRDYRAVPQLLQLLGNELLTGAVIDALGQIGDPRALYPLGKVLTEVDAVLAGHTAKAMTAIYRSMTESRSFKNSLAEYLQPEHLKNVINAQGVERLHLLLDTSNDSSVKEAALMLLGWLGDVTALDSFLNVLKDDSLMGVVESAIFSIGKKAADKLLAALQHGDDNVRIVALRVLRNFGETADPVSYAALMSSANQDLQFEAVESVIHSPSELLRPILCDLLAKGSSAVSAKAAEALGCYPFSELREILESMSVAESVDTRKRGARLLSYLNWDGDLRMVDAFLHDADPEVRRVALKAIGAHRESSTVSLLAEALQDPDAGVKVAAVMAIAEFRTPMLVEDILANLGIVSEPLDFAIVKAIGIMGAGTAAGSLVEYLENGEISKRLEYALLETLGRISAVSASELIRCRYLVSADPDIRRLAVDTLGALGDTNSIEAVESALNDSHWSVRVAALHVLGKLGGIKEIPFLMEAIKDPDPMVRKHAILTLGDIRSVTAIPALVQQLADLEMSKHAFVSLLKFGRQGLPWLHRHMLKNYTVDIRVRVIDLIGKIGDRKSVEPLMELLNDPAPAIRLAAIDSMAFCFDGLLLKRLDSTRKNDSDSEVRERAELALKTFTMERYN